MQRPHEFLVRCNKKNTAQDQIISGKDCQRGAQRVAESAQGRDPFSYKRCQKEAMLITATPTSMSLALAMRQMHRCESDTRWGDASHTRAVRSNQTIVTEQHPQKHYHRTTETSSRRTALATAGGAGASRRVASRRREGSRRRRRRRRRRR